MVAPQRVFRSSAPIVVAALIVLGCSSQDATPPTSAPAPTTTTSTVAPETASTTTTTAAPLTDHDRCLRRAVFEDQASSPYVLPYPAGDGYSIIQSYCHDDGSHENQLAYDFAMPVGSVVVAARGGVVVEVKEDVPDDENSRHFNYVMIRHEDGTVGFYAHLQHLGAGVAEGDEVNQGDEIAHSGATGRTAGPVLHFGVYFSWPPVEGRDEPISFSNADGPLDANGGLREGSFYKAT